MMIPAEAERGMCHRSKWLTAGSTRIARHAARSKVMQKELAKKQKAMRRPRTIAQRSHAIRLNNRDCSGSAELRIIPSRLLLLGVRLRSSCPPFERKEIPETLHEAVLRRKRCATNEMTANSNKRCIKALDTWNIRKPPTQASNKIPNKTMNTEASSFFSD